MTFVNLNVHSVYSLLDSACRLNDIVNKASELGQPAVALTDTGNLFAAVNFLKLCKNKNIKPVIGCEIVFSDYNNRGRLVLYVKNKTGYVNLCKILSYNSVNSVSGTDTDFSLLSKYSEGLICVIPADDGFFDFTVSAFSEEPFTNIKSIFKDDLYIGVPPEKDGLEAALYYSEKISVNPVAFPNVKLVEESDGNTLEILRSVAKNNDNSGRCFMSGSEASGIYASCPQIIETTREISDKCNFDFETGKYILPSYPLPDGITDVDYLKELSYASYNKYVKTGKIVPNEKYNDRIYRNRIEYELDVISKMGFSSYFLIVSDYVSYAKKSKIPVGPGRGSGAGSLIAYLIGITDINPIEFNLLFESFLNPERTSMPDFDIDFCYYRRDEVIEYVKEKYGKDRVCQIITFGTFGAKESIRDVARFFNLNTEKTDRVCSIIPKNNTVSLSDFIEKDNNIGYLLKDPEIKNVVDHALKIEGMPRHISKHAAGVLISDKQLFNYLPLYGNGSDVVSQYDMDSLSEIGLVKFDFLGLRYLTVIDNAEKSIYNRLNKPVSVDYNDAGTYKLLSEGKCSGVFQLESQGIKRMLTELRPNKFSDIMTAIALYRPGPMASIPDYIKNKNNPSSIKYEIPALKDILSETYGCIVYQEQVLEIFREIAGYSYGHADVIRRAISKKKAEIIDREKENFISGAVKRGLTQASAEKLYANIESFSNYGFKKSHAAAYSVLSYKTAYYKCNYPAEYYAALLSSVTSEHGKISEYVGDAVSLGVNVYRPDINQSDSGAVPDKNGKSIRLGFSFIKGVGYNLSDLIISERKGKGAFTSFKDFINRMSGYTAVSSGITSLIKCGVFDSLDKNRKKLLNEFTDGAGLQSDVTGQIALFGLKEDDGSGQSDSEDFSAEEKRRFEKELTGVDFISIEIKKQNLKSAEKKKSEEPARSLYLRHKGAGTVQFKQIMAFLSLFPGETKIVLYDDEQKKYSSVKNLSFDLNEYRLNELRAILGDNNVVIK